LRRKSLGDAAGLVDLWGIDTFQADRDSLLLFWTPQSHRVAIVHRGDDIRPPLSEVCECYERQAGKGA